MMSTAEPAILVEQRKNLLVVELNRPKALNSLTTEMCKDMRQLLTTKINPPASAGVRKEDAVGAFIMKGRGGKAFCAGGDVKTIWQGLMTSPDYEADKFFRTEYYMNYLLGTSNAPQVSIWDGIVMGGGVGISIFGEFRVATEKAMFAMPETAIGLFPDVGSSAWLPHLQNGYGAYIGLSGCRLLPADLVHTNIATHFIQSEKLADLERDIEANLPIDPAESRKYIKDLLDRYQSISQNKPDPATSHIAKHKDAIQRIFGEEVTSIEQIFSLLSTEAAKTDAESATAAWASKTLSTLQKMSPTSLKITLAQLQRGRSLDLPECLKMEFRMMMQCMANNDFKEGIRAVLVDKDNAPRWSPASMDSVSADLVESYFQPLGDRELII
jgi:enoyl-CoA hydratase/carnithine racemase